MRVSPSASPAASPAPYTNVETVPERALRHARCVVAGGRYRNGREVVRVLFCDAHRVYRLAHDRRLSPEYTRRVVLTGRRLWRERAAHPAGGWTFAGGAA